MEQPAYVQMGAAMAMLSRSVTARSAARKYAIRSFPGIPNLEVLPEFQGGIAGLCVTRYVCHSVCVLDDEPLLVLHATEMWGFELRISGISDNCQLNWILMHVLRAPVGGTWPQISSQGVECLLSSGPQSTSEHASEVWNMNAWTSPDEATLTNVQKHKIWVEGVPADIPLCKLAGGKRVRVLSKTIYLKVNAVSERFGAMKASMQIERQTSRDEVEQLLSAFRVVPKTDWLAQAVAWNKTLFCENAVQV